MRAYTLIIWSLVLSLISATSFAADANNSALPPASASKAEAIRAKAIDFLVKSQFSDGGWQKENEPPAITAIVLRSLIQSKGVDPQSNYLKKGYAKLLTYQQKDGGIYQDMLANYNTAIAISALVAAKNPDYQTNIDKAVTFLKGLQWKQKERTENGAKFLDNWYGGWGYGSGSPRPDMSNV